MWFKIYTGPVIKKLKPIHTLRAGGRADPPAHPRPRPRTGAVGRGARPAARAQPARRVEAPAGTSRRRAGRGPPGRAAAALPPAPRATRRDLHPARALPPLLGRAARPPRT